MSVLEGSSISLLPYLEKELLAWGSLSSETTGTILSRASFRASGVIDQSVSSCASPLRTLESTFPPLKRIVVGPQLVTLWKSSVKVAGQYSRRAGSYDGILSSQITLTMPLDEEGAKWSW